jgi:hypothetical protein
MKFKISLIIVQFFGVLVGANHQALFIFQEYKSAFKTEAAGMNVAHQFFACLHQKAGPILISGNIWDHILTRKKRFDAAVLSKSLVELSIIQLINELNGSLASGLSLQSINQNMNYAWYEKKYPQLASLGELKYKEKMFDFLCSNIFEFLGDWSSYQIDNYLLFVLPEDEQSFYLKDDVVKISNIKKFLVGGKNQQFYLVPMLSKLLKKESLWSFYISGHGDHADSKEIVETIVGMPLKNFKNLILFLANEIRTNLLVYSSCYGSGINLMEPYENMDEYKNLFTIITTCLTDAPVYIYGSPSGLLLPAYDTNIFLKKTDIKNNRLAWSFVQDFSQFKKYALEKNSYVKLAQAVMPYQECNGSICNLSQLENIPLIKGPEEIFFLPLDSSYIDFVIHNEPTTKMVENKSGLLWYTKQYKGTLQLVNMLPQFVNMIPGDGVIWLQRLKINNFDLKTVMQSCFFSIEDAHGVKVFIIDVLECLDENSEKIELKNCMIIPKSSWIPKDFLFDNQVGICFYQHHKDWYYLSISVKNTLPIFKKISSDRYVKFIKLWKLLRKESKSYALLDALDLIFSYKKRQESYQEILRLCRAEKICS